jgi:sulfate permease, SulP family
VSFVEQTVPAATWLRIEFWAATIIALSGLCFGLLVAVAVGVALTLFLVIYELDLLGVTELRATLDLFDVQTVGSDTAPIDGLLILRVDGPLYTANVRGVNRRVLDAVDASKPTTLGRIFPTSLAAVRAYVG